jgi:Domain of unknown function (DUF5753)
VATSIRSFETQFVPGIFQTEDYARAVIRLGNRSAPADEVERRVSVRLKRQELLASARPPQMWAILDEGVLRRPMGGRTLMRAQLLHLAEVTSWPPRSAPPPPATDT